MDLPRPATTPAGFEVRFDLSVSAKVGRVHGSKITRQQSSNLNDNESTITIFKSSQQGKKFRISQGQKSQEA